MPGDQEQQNVQGTNCQGDHLSRGPTVQGTNCPGCQLSRGPNVWGTKCLEVQMSGGPNVWGSKCPGDFLYKGWPTSFTWTYYATYYSVYEMEVCRITRGIQEQTWMNFNFFNGQTKRISKKMGLFDIF